ncbi:MAG: S8 family peptidase [Brumimicrobium sp.]
MKKIFLTLLFLTLIVSAFAQSNIIWVTINQTQKLSEIERMFDVNEAKKALPASKNENLQNVYEINVNNDYDALMKYLNNNDGFSNPVLIEDFELLFEPNDYNNNFSNNYALDLINAKDAWNITKGSPGVKLGILDSNFDTVHEELSGTFSFISPYVSGTNYNHGTAVASVSAGNTNNGVGKSSIGYKSNMIFYGMSYNHILQASYAGARVVNLSWASGCSYNAYYQSVIDEVVENGTVVVAAAGNGGTCGGASNYVYPAAFDKVIAVSSIGPNDNHERTIGDPSTTHQHNDSVDLVAPGYDVAIAIANDNYTTGNGSSFAAPYVTGTIGLMLSINPCLTTEEVAYILKQTAVSVDAQNSDYIGELGAGRLDAHAAVQMAENMIPIDYTTIVSDETCSDGVPSISINLNSGDTSNYSLQWFDGSNDWTRTDLSSGNYSFTISSPSGCSIYRTVELDIQGPAFDYPNSIYISDENTVLQDLNQDGKINVRGTIVIEEGVDYSIDNKTIHFSSNSDLPSGQGFPSSGIVVKAGASLEVNNSILDVVSDCSGTWGGIELWGNANSTSNITVDNSTIKNASIGVSNIAKAKYNANEDMYGSGLTIKKSVFENNKIGINVIETLGKKNTHNIIENTFNNTANITNQVHINLDGVELTHISKNYFNGNENIVEDKRGTGINALNSNINNTSNKPNIQSATFDNSFTDLYQGINSLNNSKNDFTLKVKNDLFVNVSRGLTLNGNHSGHISFNEFHIPSGSSNDIAFGISIIDENKLEVNSNYFSSEVGGDFNYGLISNQSTGGNGEIKLNTVEGKFKSGFEFQGENNYNEVACNTFNISGTYDLHVIANNNGDLGTLNMTEELKLNRFSDSNEVVLNVKNHYQNQTLWYKDAIDFLPYEVCGSTTTEAMNIELDWEQYCLNDTTEVIDEVNKDELLDIDNQENNNDSFKIYPNPSNGKFQISTASAKNIDNVYFTTIDGKVIESFEWNENMQFDMSNLSAGTYIVALTSKDGSSEMNRVVIQ